MGRTLGFIGRADYSVGYLTRSVELRRASNVPCAESAMKLAADLVSLSGLDRAGSFVQLFPLVSFGVDK